MGTGGFFSPGLKQPGRDVNYSPPSSADVKNDRNYASSSPFARMAWTGDVVTRKIKSIKCCVSLVIYMIFIYKDARSHEHKKIGRQPYVG